MSAPRARRRELTVLLGAAVVAVALTACGRSELDRAVKIGSLAEVRALLESGADVQKPDAHGLTPLMAAIRANRPEVARLLIERGASVRATDRRGFTALHYAAQNGMNDTAALLLDRGAPINAPAGAGRFSALHLAVIASADATAVLLVSRGAELAQENAQGFTAIDFATSRGEHKLAAALEEADAERRGAAAQVQ